MFTNRSWRVTHALDPVPLLPPRVWFWEHVQPEIYFKGKVIEGYHLCVTVEESQESCAEHHSLLPTVPLDHMNYMDVDLDNGVEHGCRFGFQYQPELLGLNISRNTR